MATVTMEMTGGEAILAKLQKLADARGSVKAGVMEGATSQGGIGTDAIERTPVLDYAPFLEFGTAGMPARPFLRTTYVNHKTEWVGIIAKALKGGASPEAALGYAGTQMEADIVDQIKSNMPPPNSPSWVRYKQKYAPANANNTLMFTGTLVHSIHSEVLPQ